MSAARVAERLCALSDLEPGTATRIDIEGHKITVVRFEGDELYAIGDTCSHANVSLSEGEVDPLTRHIECWKHGSCFSLETGEPDTLPATKPVPTYEVFVDGDDVKVVLPPVSELELRGLRASVGGKEILRGVDLVVRSGEVHAVMGPNGSGKSTLSHVIMGHPGYEVLAGTIRLDGHDVVAMAPHERAAAGLFLAMQYPTEVPGVSLEAMLTEALVGAGRVSAEGEVRERMLVEAERIGFDERFLQRPLNVDLSGGEKKRNETLQLGVLQPRIAILDEIDSGLDVDALRDVSRRVEAETNERGLGVLAITHYRRLLTELRPDVVHVLVGGRVVATGGPELADELERTGYAAFREAQDAEDLAEVTARSVGDPLSDPFADPLP